MNEREAAEVMDFAKGLFPVTKSERFDSLALVILACPKPDFAMKVLIEHSHTSDTLSIPWVKEKIDTARRAHILAIEAKARENRMSDYRANSARIDEVDAMLADFEPIDLEDLKRDVIEHMPGLNDVGRQIMLKQDPKRNGRLRREIFKRITGREPGEAQPPTTPAAPRTSATQFLGLSTEPV